MRRRSKYHDCIENRCLVEVVRPELDGGGEHLVGVPVAIGREWLVISRLDDMIVLDGFDALRLSDISEVKDKFPYRSFYVRGLRQKRESLKALPTLDLDSTTGLLRSAQRSFSLLVIHREVMNPGAVEIGTIVGASTRSYRMRLLTPSAGWVREEVSYRADDVMRVGFGGEYEETLATVAGLPDPKWR